MDRRTIGQFTIANPDNKGRGRWTKQGKRSSSESFNIYLHICLPICLFVCLLFSLIFTGWYVQPSATKLKLNYSHDWAKVSACVVLNITSIIGNSLVCLAAYRNANLRATTNLYIIALAVSDLLCVTIEISMAAACNADHWKLGPWRHPMPISRLCWYIRLKRDPSDSWLTAINCSVEIVKTSQYKKIFSPCRSKIWLNCLWLSLSTLHADCPSHKLAEYRFYLKLSNMLIFIFQLVKVESFIITSLSDYFCFTVVQQHFQLF